MKRGEIVGGRQFGKKLNKERKKYREVYEQFIQQLKIRGRAEQTIRSYHYHNKYFMEFLGEDIYCDEITLSTLEDYILYIREKKGITNGITINSYLRNISPIIKFCMKKGYILEEFLIPEVKEQEVIKEIYTNEELHDLLEKPKERDFVELRTWTIIWTFASTGIRARELRELLVKNVDLYNKTINVNKTKNKKARILPISHSFSEVLEEYLQLRGGEGEDYLFCSVCNTQLAMSSLQKCIKNYCNKRGIEKTSLHLFRHTFITNAVNQNVSPLILQRITGHSTMKELNRYYNARTTDLASVIDEIAPKSDKKESYFKKRGK
ncbi:tyrosine-type recombinase/integrase [Clostridium thailandense]|uniref:tyrosine-type recombinase/integrase n=1 Tax=Clostridium thailandense TaxID=2794346 RepID=UPI0039896034